MKWIKATVLLMTLALLLTATMSTTHGDDGAESNGLFSEVQGEPPPNAGVETIASRLVQIDFRQLDRATKPPDVAQPATAGPLAEPPPPQKLSLNLFEDAVFTAIVQQVEPTPAGYALWGGLEGMEMGSVTMVVNGSVVAGTVRTPQAVYTIRTLSDGVYVIRRIDESTLLPLGEPESRAPEPYARQATNAALDDGSEIDVMVVYTPPAEHHAGGKAGVEALIDLMVAETNQAYAQSGVNHRIRLVYRDEVEYIEDGDSYIDLNRLEYPSDGYMDRVHELRELYAADLVHLLVDTSFNVGGVANLLYRRDDGTYSDSAFGLTVGNNSAGLIFAHELGHNMGLKHDRYQVLRNEDRTDSTDGYNYGYVNQRAFRLDAPMSARWRTVMSYNRQCVDYRTASGLEDFYCQWIPRFSNPELTYHGDPLGVPVNHPSIGVDGPAHAAKALNENRHVVANFRQSSTSTSKVGLTLSPYWLAENGGSSTVTAFLNRPASADTTVTVAVSHPDAITLSENRTLTIPAGLTASVGAVTLTGIDNGNQTGDVIVTVSANAGNEAIAGPEPVELAIADDETMPVVSLSLSRPEVVDRRWDRREEEPPPLDRTRLTATLDNRSSATTHLTVSAFPVEAVRPGGFHEHVVPQSLTIPAGQTASDVPLWYIAVDDEMSPQARRSVTVSATANNPQGVIAPEDVTLTILGDGPIFVDDSIEYTFADGVAGARFLPEARYGYGQLTYSISPALGNGMTFIPGPPARLVVPKTAVAAGTTSYTLTVMDPQGYTDTMTVSVTVRGPVCPGSEAVRGYSGAGITDDCEALLAFRDALHGDRPLNWSEHLAMDEWQGVSISDGRVVEINVTSLGLNGPITSELGSLSNLRLLQLWNNQLSGPIPPELGNLHNLYALGLSYNLLTGHIPHSLSNLTNLQYLWLRGNQLAGCIPEALRNVERNDLDRLGLPFCDDLPPCPHDCELLLGVMDILVGGGNVQMDWSAYVPISEWQGVTVSGTPPRVTGLNLHNADLRGSIPPLLGDLHSLRELDLGVNRLSGEIPTELGNLTGLTRLNLGNNRLSGGIPAALNSLTNLRWLSLSGNMLTGCVPPGLRDVQYNDFAALDLPFCTNRAALVALYNATDGANWTNKTNWNTDEPIGEWHGVTTDADGNVTALDLTSNRLSGQIPSSLDNLYDLQELRLGNHPLCDDEGSCNQLSGEIPAELGSLTSLEALDLNDNQLTGPIPSELGNLNNLTRLNLTWNRLTGPVPQELGSLTSLEVLALGGNQLSGPIPTQVGTLTNLEELFLWGNRLTGPIPAGLSSLSNLVNLELTGNQLAGAIPPELGGLSNLATLDLARNRLTGPVPEELGSLTSLEVLALGGNQLSGPIPLQLGNLANLQGLFLWGNRLTGPIPAELSSLPDLVNLELNNNQLTGEIPAELGRLTSLEALELNDNQLTGPIPSQLGSLTNLQRLLLSGNRLTGPIPSQLGDLVLLQKLRLGSVDPCDDEGSCNQLSGEIPSELGNLSNLAELDLNFNQLTGEIPSSLGSLSNLEWLYLSGNQLTGEIPEELGNLAELTVLSLSRNDLTGTIPAELGELTNLARLALNDNRLTGSIPPTLSNLSELEELYLTRNKLAGPIPPELGGLVNLSILALGGNGLTGDIPGRLEDLTNLTELFLWGNQLTGRIPSELGGLTNLTELSLSENQLSGEIPADLGSLASLENLWLHENELSGEIPAEFGNLSSLEILHLWDNQLTGTIPVELGSLANLEELYLNENQLTGEIPSAFGNLTSLERLDLHNNQLTGVLPDSLTRITALTGFFFYNNSGLCASIDDVFQEWLESIADAIGSSCALADSPEDRAVLAELHRAADGVDWRNSANWLSDRPVREWHGVTTDASGRVTGLFLPGNQLTGTIPLELDNLSSLEWLSLWGNELTGEIPSELGNLTNLRSLSLSGNQLTGEIPAELGRLTNLRVLSLSGNQLTGCVPASLRDVDDHDFAQLGLPFCTPGDPLVARYDVNGNGTIERSEVIRAINDYLSGEGDPITRADVIRLINLYLSGQSADEGDRDALVALYNATGGPNWTNNSGWLTDAPFSTH